ncbi:MAG TPA: glycosyltransferase [Pyrinomonadaceae bacterium]|jgi:glycosyltransferase involved in cell wall biosynthesis
MRVGVFLEDSSPQVGGGYTFQEDIFQSLLELAGQSNHTYVVLCRQPEAVIAAAAGSNRIEASAFPGTPRQRIVSGARRALVAFGRRRQTRIEQVIEDSRIEFMWFVGDQAVQVDLPYLATVWDLQHRLQPWFPEVSARGTWRRREQFYATYLRRAAAVIAGTEAGRQEIERFYQVPPARIHVLPHPTPQFALDALPCDGAEVLGRLRLPPGYLFYPAQFWSHKNHANLLLAVLRLRERYGSAPPVVFVGSDKGNQAYIGRLAAELGLAGQVHFPGFVSRRDLIALYRNALALTYLSFFGPENLPPLEAFALGCPVIAADVSGAREQLGEAALLVDPTDVEQIAETLNSLLTEAGLRSALVQRGLARASSWTGRDFVQGVFSILDGFAPIRRCWGSAKP